jgi:hypothetical protein
MIEYFHRFAVGLSREIKVNELGKYNRNCPQRGETAFAEVVFYRTTKNRRKYATAPQMKKSSALSIDSMK